MSSFAPFPQNRQRLVQPPGQLWSARHSQHGCQGAREAGAAPPAPHGAAPPPIKPLALSTVVDHLPPAFPLSDARGTITAVLTTFEGQAVFRLITTNLPDMRTGDLFRLRKGSRLHARRGAGS